MKKTKSNWKINRNPNTKCEEKRKNAWQIIGKPTKIIKLLENLIFPKKIVYIFFRPRETLHMVWFKTNWIIYDFSIGQKIGFAPQMHVSALNKQLQFMCHEPQILAWSNANNFWMRVVFTGMRYDQSFFVLFFLNYIQWTPQTSCTNAMPNRQTWRTFEKNNCHVCHIWTNWLWTLGGPNCLIGSKNRLAASRFSFL